MSLTLGLMLGLVTAIAGTGAAAERDVGRLLADLDIKPLDGATPREFSLNDLADARLSLRDLKGRPALLYFWATW